MHVETRRGSGARVVSGALNYLEEQPLYRDSARRLARPARTGRTDGQTDNTSARATRLFSMFGSWWSVSASVALSLLPRCEPVCPKCGRLRGAPSPAGSQVARSQETGRHRNFISSKYCACARLCIRASVAQRTRRLTTDQEIGSSNLPGGISKP